MAVDSVPRLFFGQDMDRADIYPFAGGAAAVFSAKSPTRESSNEDSAGIIPMGNGAGILAVADGMGGGAAGEHASQLAIQTLKDSIKSVRGKDIALRTAILNGIEAAHQAVFDLGVGAATTLAVAEIQNQTVRTYHVGDSMILLVGGRGKIKLQTVSHSPVGYAVEAGVLDEAEALHHEDRHLVSNVVGLSNMRVEIGSAIELHPRDTLLLASDGLFDNLHIQEIVDRVRKGSLEKAVQQLACDACERMTEPISGQPSKSDDLTFVAYRMQTPSRNRTTVNGNSTSTDDPHGVARKSA